MNLTSVERAFTEKHYEELAGKPPFFDGLVDYVMSGPVVTMVWEGKNVIAVGRKIIGTIRARRLRRRHGQVSHEPSRDPEK
ncbi:hypothetical protein Taro_000837 [Colocasia esculenta]|uniref:nucleoside-diphosphate kinase n=1 Tax=Colocasia esculenta TaxID=4460 RepID=A0A843TIV6_COLES|nr:hypothetical protein [Colocasia esculenta]